MQHHVEVVRGLVLAKMKITSKLPHAKETPLEKEITYICDFRRYRLNVRLTARIQPLLRGHKYRVSAFFGSCLLAVEVKSELI